MSKVLLVVANTPDMPEVIAAGTMAKHARNGWDVYQLLLGDGERGTATKYSVEEARRIRREEQRNAAKIEGCKEVFFMPLPIGNIMPDYEAKAGIRDYIRRLKPNVIITTHIESTHPDVRNTAIATVDAALWALWGRDSLTGAPAEQPAHAPNIIYMGGVPGFDWKFHPDVFINITDVMDVKRKALEQYRSTWELPPYYGPDKWIDLLQSFCRTWGACCGVDYAEAFEPYWMSHYARRALEQLPVV